MLNSQSLSIFFNRATKPLRSSTHKNALSGAKDPQKKIQCNSDASQSEREKQALVFRSLDALSTSNNDSLLQSKNNSSVIVANCGGCDCSAFIILNLRIIHYKNNIKFILSIQSKITVVGTQLRNGKEKYALWLIGITPDPAISSTKPRIISYEYK
ncbi:unnamed protein product [Thelazia callipaeda]|uniref:Uncharacterized protein n=1 Tax=Thelazia callipaeda TaxID=103827 RepID=A0A0N5CS13_THECL|nr:unnamed protein product [Thelazia callipaeda]